MSTPPADPDEPAPDDATELVDRTRRVDRAARRATRADRPESVDRPGGVDDADDATVVVPHRAADAGDPVGREDSAASDATVRTPLRLPSTAVGTSALPSPAVRTASSPDAEALRAGYPVRRLDPAPEVPPVRRPSTPRGGSPVDTREVEQAIQARARRRLFRMAAVVVLTVAVAAGLLIWLVAALA